jgi:hypothetical protein
MKNIITQRQFTSSSGEQNSHLTASKTSSPGTKNVITRRQKRHHLAPRMSSPGVKNVITRLVRVIQLMATA